MNYFLNRFGSNWFKYHINVNYREYLALFHVKNVYSTDFSLTFFAIMPLPNHCLGHYINIDIHNKNFNEKVLKIIFFNIFLLLQSELPRKDEQKPSLPHWGQDGFLMKVMILLPNFVVIYKWCHFTTSLIDIATFTRLYN